MRKFTCFLLGTYFILYLSIHTEAQIITTFAGNNSITYSGDGGPATIATLSKPIGVTVDGSGNVYFSDQGNSCIRMINTSGIITTVAGNGTAGYSGDGGIASAATLSHATGVTIDAIGNVYIADYDNNCIRKINTSGIITTIAGNGTAGFSGDGGVATSAKLNQPSGVAVDATGNVYIADLTNQRIRKVNTSGVITTVAGTGSSGYSGDGGAATLSVLHQPYGVAVDGIGNIYIADQINGRVRKVNTSGIITTIAGDGILGYSGDGGMATMSELYQPSSIFIDATGNLFIADIATSCIRKINTSGIITTVAGNGIPGYTGDGGLATVGEIRNASGVAVDVTGNIFIADMNNNRMREVNTLGVISTLAGNGIAGIGDGGPATVAVLNNPYDVILDALGNAYVSDNNNNRIRKINTSGIISTYAGNGLAGYIGDGFAATNASLNGPNGLAFDALGDMYIADVGNCEIRKVDSMGIISTIAGNGTHIFGGPGDGGPATAASLNHPNYIAVDNIGNLYISDNGNFRIRKVNTLGVITTIAGTTTPGYSGDGGPATAAEMGSPTGVIVDPSGNVFFSDEGNYVIRKIDTFGIISTIAGNGLFGYSGDGGPATDAMLSEVINIDVDGSGNLYIADDFREVVRMVNVFGVISTIIGNGSIGYSGDGGPATAASLYAPGCANVDSHGNIYIADAGNNVIRRVSANPKLLVTRVNSEIGSLKIFPNPTTNEITIISNEPINEVAVTNLLGQTVDNHQYNATRVLVDVSDLPAGVYVVRINGSDVRKFVKQQP